MNKVFAKKKFEYKSSITAEQIDNIMSAAMQGMTYWVDSIELKDEKDSHRIKYLSEATARNVPLIIHDAEAEKTYTLTRKMILRAVERTDNHDFDSYDMNDSEKLVQLALFGKVRYG